MPGIHRSGDKNDKLKLYVPLLDFLCFYPIKDHWYCPLSLDPIALPAATFCDQSLNHASVTMHPLFHCHINFG